MWGENAGGEEKAKRKLGDPPPPPPKKRWIIRQKGVSGPCRGYLASAPKYKKLVVVVQIILLKYENLNFSS